MATTLIANLKGSQGIQGVQGLPGANAVANDTAFAALITNASVTATQTALDNRYGTRINVKRYGALGDSVRIFDAAITTGTTSLSSAQAAFTVADAGKAVHVFGAGTAGASLVATISSVSGGIATLSLAAGTTVSSAQALFGTDDTNAIKAAITYAKTLVRNSANTKQQDGATVYIPKGGYLVSSNILIDESNITLEGDSYSASVLYAPNATFNMVTFDNPSLAIYNNGIKNLRFSTPGNATAGYQLTVKHAIYFIAENLLFNGWFGGMYIGGCGKMISSKLIFSQEVRANTTTTTGAAVYMGSDYTYSSDIHFTDLQIMEDIAYAGVNSFIVTGVDGLYIENAHIHGTFIVNPSGTGNEVVVSTIAMTNCYFDGSRDADVILAGNPTAAYKDIRFVNCYFRAGLTGLRLSSTASIRAVIVSNCTFAQNTQNGIELTNSNVNDIIIAGCIFFGNNAVNSASYGDMLLNGNAVQVSDCDFSGGGALGTAITVAAAASYVILSNLGFINSAAVTKINNLGLYTSFKGIVGWNAKVKGTVTIPISATTATITHFCKITPVLESIQLTPGASCPLFWVTAVGATTFQVNFASATAAAFTMGYMVDMEY